MCYFKQSPPSSSRWSFSKYTALILLFFLISIYSTFGAFQANTAHVVTGTVTNAATSNPIEGVTILEKGTNTAVVTNANGQYTITVQNEKAADSAYLNR